MVEASESESYLQSLESIRVRCSKVLDAAKEDRLECFQLDMSKLHLASELIIQLIERDYGPLTKQTLAKIPPHGRWLHFGNERVQNVINLTGEKALEAVLDLFVVAVLLDAGAGDVWKFTVPETGEQIGRSEGLAVATYYMFINGKFSSDPIHPLQVDATGLAKLNLSDFVAGFQVSESNPIVGLEGRFNLLKKLGETLQRADIPYFHGAVPRPSNFFAHLKAKSGSNIEIDALWEVVVKGFGSIWPAAGAQIDGVSLGDAWTARICGTETIIPFHKLSQWLTYSLMVPITRLSPYKIVHAEKMTGLPEYRNGGLFVDLGILQLKPDCLQMGLSRPEASNGIPAFRVNEQVIVEWRALTVCLLDLVAEDLHSRLGATKEELTLPMVLEAGTWKAGRELAAKHRPPRNNPPISIISDGTVF